MDVLVELGVATMCYQRFNLQGVTNMYTVRLRATKMIDGVATVVGDLLVESTSELEMSFEFVKHYQAQVLHYGPVTKKELFLKDQYVDCVLHYYAQSIA